jgi:hypothetical protein
VHLVATVAARGREVIASSEGGQRTSRTRRPCRALKRTADARSRKEAASERTTQANGAWEWDGLDVA